MKAARATAVALGLLSITGFVGQVVLEWGTEDASLLGWGFGAAFLLFALVGAVVAHRRPANPTAWAVLAIGALECIDGSGLELHGAFAGATGGWRASILAWEEAANAIGPAVNTLMLMLFPSGNLLHGKRWRAGVVVVIGWAAAVFATTYVAGLHPATAWAEGSELLFRGAPLVLLLGFLAMVARFRASGAEVRQQVKWVAFAAALVVVGLGTMIVGTATGLADRFGHEPFYVVFLLSLVSMPISIGIAVLRHHLFDIDRLIGRTVSYALITAFLATSYVGVVLALGAATRATGASSDLAVAVSTLVVAALFQPVRRWVQRLVDRRFNRRRYDAARTVAAFGAELRREVRLDRLADDLQQVVATSVLPRHTSVWMLPEPK